MRGPVLAFVAGIIGTVGVGVLGYEVFVKPAPPAPPPCTSYDRRVNAPWCPPPPHQNIDAYKSTLPFIEAKCDGVTRLIDLYAGAPPVRVLGSCEYRFRVIHGTFRIFFHDGTHQDFTPTSTVGSLKEASHLAAVGSGKLTLQITFCPRPKTFKPNTYECTD